MSKIVREDAGDYAVILGSYSVPATFNATLRSDDLYKQGSSTFEAVGRLFVLLTVTRFSGTDPVYIYYGSHADSPTAGFCELMTGAMVEKTMLVNEIDKVALSTLGGGANVVWLSAQLV